MEMKKPLDSVGWLGGSSYRIVINEEVRRKATMRVIHWPEENQHCLCGASFGNDAALREHCRIWLAGLRGISFKRHTTDKGEPYWISQTRTPMHTLMARPDRLMAGRQYVIRCQCGWLRRAELPLSGNSQDLNSPGRLAVTHIREVVEKLLQKFEEATA